MRAECVDAVMKAGAAIGKKITATDLRDIETKIRETRKQIAKDDRAAYNALSREDQLKAAGERVVLDIIGNGINKRNRAALTIIKKKEREEIYGKMMANGLSRMEALRYHTFFKADGRGNNISMEKYAAAISNKTIGNLKAFRELESSSSFAGLATNKQNMYDFLKESYGQDSGNALAKRAWKEVDAARKSMIKDFNRFGGAVAELANYRNPQMLDTYRVLTRGGDGGVNYINDHMSWIDREEYVNTNGELMNDDQLKIFLKEAWVTLSTDGQNKPPGEAGGAGSVANRMMAHRQIHYKSPEAYIAAMEKYGAGNPLDQTRAMFESMARNIALVEKFGPNAVLEFNHDFSVAQSNLTKADRGWLNTPSGLKAAFERFSGQRSIADIRIARYANTIRALEVANKLGSMLISQLSDLGTMDATARAMNIPAHELVAWNAALIADPHLRENMAAHGIGVEAVTNTIARWADDTSSNNFFEKAAVFVVNVQGANVWTRAERQAFGATMEAKFGSFVTRYKKMSELHERDREILESKGVTDKDFSIWKMATPYDYKGSKMLSGSDLEDIPLSEILKAIPDEVSAVQAQGGESISIEKRLEEVAYDARRAAALKLQAMMVEETHMAVVQPSELQSFNYERGTYSGELFGLIAMFKSFPWSLYRQHFLDRANYKAAGYNPIVYRARLLATTTILGGAGLLIGDILTGKDPREVLSGDKEKMARFGIQAMLKGGGLGSLGEFVEMIMGTIDDPVKTGAKLLGPAVGYAVGTVAQAGVKGGTALVTGEQEDIEAFTKYSYDSIKGVVPGQNLWFLKGVLHNVLLQDMQEMASPGYTERAKKRTEKNYGNQYWLGMGEETRPPNLMNVTGEE